MLGLKTTFMFTFHFTKRASGVSTLAVIALMGLGACQSDSINDDVAPVDVDLGVVDANEDGHTDLDLDVNEDEITTHLDDLGVNWEDAEPVSVAHPDGTTKEYIQVEGDILFTEEQYRDATGDDELKARQYRTNNLVSPRTIRVVGYTGGGGFGLTDAGRTGLRWAVDNYNALNLSIRFELSYGATTDADILVYRQRDNSNVGGRAGFPFGDGRPFNSVQVYTGMDNQDNNTNEHVIGHELGHCIGFRHTDYFSRQSCNQTGESPDPQGAILIPGTPSGYDENSIMLACFFDGTDGEFGQFDVVALRYLY